MISILICLGVFALTARLTRRSLVDGLVAVIAVGYGYGLGRALLQDTFSHFIFDAAVLGFYVGEPWKAVGIDERQRTAALRVWVTVLIAWPALLMIVPFQDFLVQVVGLRGNVFLLPFLLVGARLTAGDLLRLAKPVAVLNLIAFSFAVIEFFIGVDAIYPPGPVTEIVYRSRDLAGFTAYRIPATFSSAHAYAGTMVITLPLLIGAWIHPSVQADRRRSVLILLAVAASLIGVFMSGVCSHAAVLFALVVTLTFTAGVGRGFAWGRWLLVVAGVAWLVSGEERLQRFEGLHDTDFLSRRVAGSVNKTFFEIMNEHPLGNGLGGGGTSIPHFLEDRLDRRISMENEYARIVLEQGIPGLVIWVLFLAWLFTRGGSRRDDPWHLGRRLAQVTCACYFASGLIGVGLLTSVPQTCLLLLLSGWMATPQTTPGETGVAAEGVAERPERAGTSALAGAS